MRECDSEDAAFCIKFKACESETEQLRASFQLSGCRVASSRFSMKTNSGENNTNGNIEVVCVCFYLCLQQLLLTSQGTSENFIFFIISLFFPFTQFFSCISRHIGEVRQDACQCCYCDSNFGRCLKFIKVKGQRNRYAEKQ